jgi:hypothetical protein
LNVTVSSGVDKLFGRIGFSTRIQNPKISVTDILNDCKDDLTAYTKLYSNYWLYHANGVRINNIQDVHSF